MNKIPVFIALLVGVPAAAVVLGLAGSEVAGEEKPDPAAEALSAAIERGRALFRNEAFGTNGKSCSGCHDNPDKPKLHLASRVNDYPKYDRRERRVITLGQKVTQMMERMLKAEPPELGSQELVDIEAWLMKLARGE